MRGTSLRSFINSKRNCTLSASSAGGDSSMNNSAASGKKGGITPRNVAPATNFTKPMTMT